MDVLKQLEAKLRALVDQRNELRRELDGLKQSRAGERQELARLEERAMAAESERDGLLQEREGLRKDVEKILKLLEAEG